LPPTETRSGRNAKRQVVDDGAVDHDAAFPHQPFDGPSRSQAAHRQVPVDADAGNIFAFTLDNNRKG